MSLFKNEKVEKIITVIFKVVFWPALIVFIVGAAGSAFIFADEFLTTRTCEVFMDNATEYEFSVSVKGNSCELPPLSNLCIKTRIGSKYVIVAENYSGVIEKYLLDASHASSEDKYVVNLSRANSYVATVSPYRNI